MSLLARWFGVAAVIAAFFTVGAAPASAQAGGHWVECAQEGGFCRLPYPATVRFGAGGRFAERHADHGIPCNNSVFGDPAYGLQKRCFFFAHEADAGPVARPAHWVPCASEGQFCNLPHPTRVRYGASGRYSERRVDAGGIECSNRVFGDPIPGIVKACSFLARN